MQEPSCYHTASNSLQQNMLASQSIEDSLKRLRAERDEADRLYNEALTALDRAMPPLPGVPDAPPPYDEHQITPLNAKWSILPVQFEAAVGLRGRLQAAVWRVVGPFLQRQQEFNSAVVDHLNRNVQHHRATRERLVETIGVLHNHLAQLVAFQTRLILYLQQITLYVDSRDRDAAGIRLPLAAAISAVGDELHKRWEAIGILQQATMSMKRELERLSTGGPAEAGHDDSRTDDDGRVRFQPDRPSVGASLEGFKYVGFEDRYRGSREAVREKLAQYVSLFDGASNVLDVGCGRGEFLELLRERGVSARGVDLNPDMVALCRTAGFEAIQSDALALLSALPDASLGGLFSSQLIEHLPPDYLVRFLETAFHKLKPGAKIALETINPACWAAFFSAYLRDITHAQPIHPETLSYLASASGFVNVNIRYSAPFSDAEKLQPATDAGAGPELRAAIDTYNGNVEKLNTLMFTYRDYAVIAERATSA
jgi:SAM-dependent methyltransferase